jgi:two-component system chemotaxis sensor kinase CheA
MSVDAIERMRIAFRSEAMELLAELDAALLALEVDPGDSEFVNRVFRAIHTIKGSGATAGFVHLAAVAHKVEEVFDLARSGKLAITGDLVDCGLKACDVLLTILCAPDPDAECPDEQSVHDALAALLPAKAAHSAGPTVPAESKPIAAERAAFEVLIRPHRDLFYSGADPITLLDELRALGQAHITGHSDGVPLFYDLEPESCYLWWEVMLVTDRGEGAIREVFSFVEDQCDVTVRAIEDQSSAVALLGTIPPEFLALFATECQEHLEAIESQALDLEGDNSSHESLDALFRAVHSIKGNAGLLIGQVGASLAGTHPLPVLARIAHALESSLDGHRQNGGSPVDSATVTLVLESRDAMQGLLESLTGRSRGFVVPAHLLEQLGLEQLGLQDRVAASSPSSAGSSAFRNTATQCLDLFENCLLQLEKEDPGQAIFKTYQRGLKTLASAAAYQKRPDLDEPVAEQLRILAAVMRAGNLLTSKDRTQLRDSYRETRSKIDGLPAAPPAGEKAAPNAIVAKSASAAPTTIRIDQEKLDRLMRVVGELLVARGAIPTLVEKLSAGEDRAKITRALKEAGAGISHIAEELQASVMAIRMLPVKTVFQRFPRLVRDLARSLGKEVQLVVEGETVELDKTIVDQIGDPLVHLVRNAVDHGLERPEERTAHGKQSSGRLTLRASTDAGNVIIEVEDDGRGLDPEALKRKAVERGLITREAALAMPHAEACRLAFLPGLSTAEKVTDVSGRGVGMDVVGNNIRSLQGLVDIRSTPGAGTVISIKLPTSLIVSKGILLEAGGQEYILPLSSIRDMVKVPAADVHDYHGMSITQVRGEIYSVFSLAEVFGLPVRTAEEVPIAIIESGKVRYGLIADRFVSEVEVLVKPLAGGLEHSKEFHGAAIMGDGRVVLVLNPLECHRLEGVGTR